MDILILDKEFKLIKLLDKYNSLIWHEKYFTTGSVKLVTSEFLGDGLYIYCKDFTHLGVIDQVVFSKDVYTYSGNFIKNMLSNKVISTTQNYINKTPEFIAKDLVTKFARQNILVEPNKNFGSPISIQVTGDNLLEFIHKILEPQELGCRIEYNYLNNSLTFKVYKGEDLTTSKIPLSKNFENINNFEYKKDIAKFKNFAYVAGEEKEGKPRTIVTVDRTNGAEKKEIWVDAKDLQTEKDGVVIPPATYKEMLVQRGLEKLSENKVSESVVIDLVSMDFACGDKVAFKDSEHGIYTEQIVTEVLTGVENSTVKKDIVFGLQKISPYDKLKREVK